MKITNKINVITIHIVVVKGAHQDPAAQRVTIRVYLDRLVRQGLRVNTVVKKAIKVIKVKKAIGGVTDIKEIKEIGGVTDIKEIKEIKAIGDVMVKMEIKAIKAIKEIKEYKELPVHQGGHPDQLDQKVIREITMVFPVQPALVELKLHVFLFYTPEFAHNECVIDLMEHVMANYY